MQLHNHLSGFLEVFKMHTRVNKSEKHKKKKKKKKRKRKKRKILLSGFSNGKGTRLGDARLWREL